MADRVSFTPRSAGRIARAVLKVEAGDRRNNGLSFSLVSASSVQEKTFRVCTYSGPWSIGDAKTVTFKNQTNTPNTVSATNLFLPLPDNGTRDCAVAKDGSEWYLLQVQWDAADVVVNASLTTAALEFGRAVGLTLGTASTVQISISTCATATA